MDSLPNFLTHGAPLRARESSAKNGRWVPVCHHEHLKVVQDPSIQGSFPLKEL